MIANYICRFFTLLLSVKILFLENRAQTTKWEYHVCSVVLIPIRKCVVCHYMYMC